MSELSGAPLYLLERGKLDLAAQDGAIPISFHNFSASGSTRSLVLSLDDDQPAGLHTMPILPAQPTDYGYRLDWDIPVNVDLRVWHKSAIPENFWGAPGLWLSYFGWRHGQWHDGHLAWSLGHGDVNALVPMGQPARLYCQQADAETEGFPVRDVKPLHQPLMRPTLVSAVTQKLQAHSSLLTIVNVQNNLAHALLLMLVRMTSANRQIQIHPQQDSELTPQMKKLCRNLQVYFGKAVRPDFGRIPRVDDVLGDLSLFDISSLDTLIPEAQLENLWRESNMLSDMIPRI